MGVGRGIQEGDAVMSCCEFHGVDCVQGRRCPVNAFYAETEPIFPCVTGCSTKALPDPAKQPLPVIDKPRSSLAMLTLKWFGVALLFTFLSALTVQAAELFLTELEMFP